MNIADLPYDRLIDVNGVIRLVGEGGRADDYLDTPAITVTDRAGFADLGDRIVAYSFSLSAEPDQWWQQLFVECYERQGRPIGHSVKDVTFSKATMKLMCLPANLEVRYATVKTAIAAANLEYVRLVAQVRERIKKHQEELSAKRQVDEMRTKQISDGFGNLKL